jgi:hypothetical protein
MPRQRPEAHTRIDSHMACVDYPTHFSDQLLMELIETDNQANKIAAEPTALVRHHFAILIQIQIQIKATCEVKKPCSKLVYLAS